MARRERLSHVWNVLQHVVEDDDVEPLIGRKGVGKIAMADLGARGRCESDIGVWLDPHGLKRPRLRE